MRETQEGPIGSEAAAAGTELAKKRAAFRAPDFIWYLVKAVFAISVLLGLTPLILELPSPLVGVCWAVFAAAATFGYVFSFMFGKLQRSLIFKEGSLLAKANNGRTLTIIISFLLAVVGVGGLLFEVRNWQQPQWAAAYICAIAYAFIFIWARKRISNELVEQLQKCAAMRTTSVIVLIALGLFFAVFSLITMFVSPPSIQGTSVSTAYESIAAAVLSMDLTSYQSNIVKIGLQFSEFSDRASCFVTSMSFAQLGVAGLVYKIVVYCASLAGLTAILNVCAMGRREFVATIAPLESIVRGEEKPKPFKKFKIWMIALPIVFAIAFTAADFYVGATFGSEQMQQLFSQGESAARYIDNKYYDQAEVDSLVNEIDDKVNQVLQDAQGELEDPIRAVYDAKKKNIDNYLKWYFSVEGEIFRKQCEKSDTAEQDEKNALNERLNEGIDFDSIEEKLNSYRQKVNTLYEIKDECMSLIEKKTDSSEEGERRESASSEEVFSSLKKLDGLTELSESASQDFNPISFVRYSVIAFFDGAMNWENMEKQLGEEIDAECEEALQRLRGEGSDE